MKELQNLVYRTPGPQHEGPKGTHENTGGNNRDKKGPPEKFAVFIFESFGDKGGKEKGKDGLYGDGDDRVEDRIPQGSADINIPDKPEKIGKSGPFRGLYDIVFGKGKIEIHYNGDKRKKTDQNKAGQYV
jgi:hypothetical protein